MVYLLENILIISKMDHILEIQLVIINKLQISKNKLFSHKKLKNLKTYLSHNHSKKQDKIISFNKNKICP